jgi:hypothetical protein
VDPEKYSGLMPLYIEYGVGGYLRRFTLGEAIDREHIQAQLRNGGPDVAPAQGRARAFPAHLGAGSLKTTISPG